MAELPEPARKMESLSEAVFDPRYGHIVYLHDGIAFTPDMTAATIQALEDFPMDPRDVSVVGYPKSGTNWLAIVLARLYPYWESTKVSGTGRVPDLHVPSRPAIGFEGFGEALASPPPRLLKSHANFRHMPRAFREEGQGRAIYIARNPKDVCDSYFNQLKGWLPEDWGWENHFEAFLEGHVFFGSWLENVLGWYAQRDNPQVLILRYEDMRRDPRAAIDQIVAFVGPVPDGTVERVLAETEFAAMQTGELSQRYQPQMVRREGRSGGWKRRFTVAQSEAMDSAFGPALAAIGWQDGIL